MSADKPYVYDASPSWKAYFGVYVGCWAIAVILIVVVRAVHGSDAAVSTKLVDLVVPLAMAAAVTTLITLRRRSTRVRVSSTGIESETGLLGKRIRVTRFEHCKNVAYRQTMGDRLLGIAHIEVHTDDVVTPRIEIVGVPADRALLEHLRNAISPTRRAVLAHRMNTGR